MLTFSVINSVGGELVHVPADKGSGIPVFAEMTNQDEKSEGKGRRICRLGACRSGR
jgi:hypothetical protein